MTKEQIGKIIGIVLATVLALLAVFGYDVIVIQPRDAATAQAVVTQQNAVDQAVQALALPAEAGMATRGTGYNTACYLEQGGAQFTGDSGCTIRLNSGAALTAVAGASVTLGNLVLTATEITPTAGQTITPASGMYIINSSGAVSMTLAAPTVAGQVVYLYGDDNNTVTINDTNIRSTDGNAVTLGQYDVVEFISTATEWIHVAKSADS
jgi:hypothetical protein